MDWHSDIQRAFVGDDADALLATARQWRHMGLWPDGMLMRLRMTTGEAAWLRVTNSGGLQCVAIAPWDDGWQSDFMPHAALYGQGKWPATWRRKAIDLAGWDKARPDIAWEGQAWALGLLADKASVVLCKPLAWTDARLDVVLVDPVEDISIATRDHEALRWWPYDRFPQGVQALWDKGLWRFANYRFFAISASNEMRRLGLLPKVVRKRAKPSKD